MSSCTKYFSMPPAAAVSVAASAEGQNEGALVAVLRVVSGRFPSLVDVAVEKVMKRASESVVSIISQAFAGSRHAPLESSRRPIALGLQHPSVGVRLARFSSLASSRKISLANCIAWSFRSQNSGVVNASGLCTLTVS